MKVVALDISTHSGWAILEGQPGQTPQILKTGIVANDKPVSGFGAFPFSYLLSAKSVAERLAAVVREANADVVVVEEINKPGRFGNRYAQKVLDFIHCLLLQELYPESRKVVYVNTSDWRRSVGAQLTKADKALNIKVRKLKKAGDKTALKALGVRGKINKKHVAIRFVNQTFGTDFKMKDNDICDAIAQGVAYFQGVSLCDGT